MKGVLLVDSIIITPNVGIGPFKLGMRESEVKQVFSAYNHWRPDDSIPANPGYLEMLFGKFEYDPNGRVKFIELINPSYAGHFNIPCLFNGIDVFATKAEDLINELGKENRFIGDSDPKTGFSFVFKEIELAFWREDIMNDEILESKEFLEMCKENQELKKRYFFFTTVSVAKPGYF